MTTGNTIGTLIIATGIIIASWPKSQSEADTAHHLHPHHNDQASFDNYCHTFFMIQRHADLQRYMSTDPGYLWMRRRWRLIVTLIISFITIYCAIRQ